MLEPWALKYKWLKKVVAWHVYQARSLGRAAVLHAASESEAENLRLLGLCHPIAVVTYGVPLPQLSPPDGASPSHRARTALYLSRLHPKKGLEMLLEAWAQVNPPGWSLVVAGSGDPGYTAYLRRRAGALGLNETVRFVGDVRGTAKDALLRGADLFVLPSYSENFAIAVAEALASGVSVLTTRGTPWSELELHGCGWWVDPTPSALARGLSEATNTPHSELVSRGYRGHRLISKKYGIEGATARMLQTYEWALGRTARPAHVWV